MGKLNLAESAWFSNTSVSHKGPGTLLGKTRHGLNMAPDSGSTEIGGDHGGSS